MELIPAFRCERCGYDLSVIAADERCQECGTPVAESRPEYRPGVPWQHDQTIVNWLRTLWVYTIRPFRTFRRARVESRTMRRLAATNIIAAIVLAGATFGVSLLMGRQTLHIASGPISHILIDGAPAMLLSINVLVGVIAFPIFLWSASWYKHRAKTPRHPAVTWVSAGLTSGIFVVGTLASSLLWFLRAAITPPATLTLPPGTPIAGSGELLFWSIAFAVPQLVYLGLLLTYAAVDIFANKVNHLANSLDPQRPPSTTPS